MDTSFEPTHLNCSLFSCDPFLMDSNQTGAAFQSNSGAIQAPVLEHSSTSFHSAIYAFDQNYEMAVSSQSNGCQMAESSFEFPEEHIGHDLFGSQVTLRTECQSVAMSEWSIDTKTQFPSPSIDHARDVIQPYSDRNIESINSGPPEPSADDEDAVTLLNSVSIQPSIQLQTPNVCAVHPTSDPKVFVFQCTIPRCQKQTFSRWYDFERHYNGAHAAEKTVFWCPVPNCSRSAGEGHRPFPRKDKMKNHAFKTHNLQSDGMDLGDSSKDKEM